MTKAPAKNQRRLLILALIITGAIIGIGAAAYMLTRDMRVRNKVERVRADMRTIAIAVMGLQVDDCGDSNPDANNRLPAKLTTPVAYLKSFPQDPFSPSRETYRLLNQRHRGNGTYFIVASRGPDGVWDIDRLP